MSILLQALIVLAVTSKRTYEDAECNGDTIVAVASPFKEEALNYNVRVIDVSDTNSPQIELTKVKLPPLPNKLRTKVRSMAIQPCTQIIYTLLGDAAQKEHFLGTFDVYNNPFDNPYNISIIGQVNISDDDAVPSIAFNNEGMLFAIHVDGRMFQIDISTGDHNQVDIRTTNTGANCTHQFPLPSDNPQVEKIGCREVLGFNWDNELFYRISSSSDGNNFIESFEIGGTGIQLTFSDPSGYCDRLVRELTYIGNHLWLMMCADASSASDGIRLMDTLSGITAQVLPIGTNGIETQSGGGIIGSITDNGETILCEPKCPTITPTQIPTITPTQVPTISTSNPTINPTASDDSSSSEHSSDDGLSANEAYNKELYDFEENVSEYDYTVDVDPYYIYGFVFMFLTVNIIVCIAYWCFNRRATVS